MIAGPEFCKDCVKRGLQAGGWGAVYAIVSQSEVRPPRLLLVDDDRELCELLRDYLEPLGYDVQAVHNGPDGVARAIAEEWQAVILDVMLPGMDGFEVLKGIRKTSMVPVLMLTSRGDEMDRIVGLEVGADDYLPKTFSMRELLARLRAVTRRASLSQTQAAGPANDEDAQPEVVVGKIRVNPNNRVALLDDRPLSLTPVEFDILYSLARARGRVKSREQLLDEIRDREWEVFDRSVDVHIAALRRKLGDDARQPRFIRTLRSAGYMLVDPEEV
ncbi:response regulator transcription factor [Roseimicrobium sp. ORNL1]|nr:response regulator transcription factor [Roseimicrobium sp. ORNL1]